ncbi:MAG: polysaccharide biosynthesis tyrosine autokinase [Microbacteriaceae bacterium]|nr:polysaccharide biosynthesis tyrosine autokinase [Microbacteriaceae bacterium]
MELRDYIRVLRKRWVLVVALTLVGVAAAAVASLLMTPKYQARTLSFVSVQNGGSITEFAQGTTFAQTIIRSFPAAVSSPTVLDAVVDDPELGLDETATELADSVSASAVLNSVNLEITVTRADPVEAANIANAVTASFRTQASELTRPAEGEASPVVVTILTPAEVPTEPISPNTKLNLALGVLLGLVVGLAIALLIEVLDTRIRGEHHVRQLTQSPILGGIAFDKFAPKRPLIVQTEPRSPRAEAFRSLRTNLQFLDVEGGPRSFVVTSSVPAEGKSTTSANLAIVMAQSGARVLLIDGDLRSPSVAEMFGIEGAVGLSDVLIARVRLQDATQLWGLKNLAILPAGAMPPNPSELLGSQAMVNLLRHVEQEYDIVLIDAPPLLPVTDSALLSKHVRGALVVVAAGKTHRGQVSGSLESLQNVGAHIAGIVLTMLPTRGPDAYGYGRYGYGAYGYGYGYGGTGETGFGQGLTPADAPVRRQTPGVPPTGPARRTVS